jgi:hypothetical protein
MWMYIISVWCLIGQPLFLLFIDNDPRLEVGAGNLTFAGLLFLMCGGIIGQAMITILRTSVGPTGSTQAVRKRLTGHQRALLCISWLAFLIAAVLLTLLKFRLKWQGGDLYIPYD